MDVSPKRAEMVFTSGNKIAPWDHVIGIGPDGEVYGGWDDALDPESPLTPADKIELADYMIERWRRYREAAGNETENQP